MYMGGCQNYGSRLGAVSIRCRIILGIQKGTIILTTTHMISVQLGQDKERGCRGEGDTETFHGRQSQL